MTSKRPRRSLLVLAAAWSLASPCTAGPPFVTDDPEPTEFGHWEIYDFLAGSHVPGESDGQLGLDINYGGAPDLQLTATVPLDYLHRGSTEIGVGNVELGAKFRFLHQQEGSLLPDVAFFPRLITPTAGRLFGTRHLSILLPIWAERDLGRWSIFWGGGYDINPGAGQRDFATAGAAVSRAIGKRLTIGVEADWHGRDADDARSFAGVNVGATYRLSQHWSLLASAGPGVEHARSEGSYSFYAALKADY